MKGAIIFTGSGPIIIVTCCNPFMDPILIQRLAEKGIEKFIAFELPIDLIRERYGNHFNVVCQDLTETDELRVIDYDGDRVLGLFEFSEYGPPFFHEMPRKEVSL